MERYDKFTSLILSLYRSIQKIKSMEMKEFGLKGNQVQCLYHLNLSEGLSLGKLCALCYEDKGAMSRTIKSLIEKGYVEQKVGDLKYKNPYILTNLGREIATKVEKLTKDMVNKGSKGIAIEERDSFYKNLSIVANNLIEVCKTYGVNNG